MEISTPVPASKAGRSAADAPASPPASALVREGVGRTLFGMAFPLLAGTFAMNAYALTDTWFVSRLGTVPLAAMGFIFPVVMLLMCVAMGIGTATTTLVSHALGRHERGQATRLIAHGLTLMGVIAALLSVAGYLLMTPVFSHLGADETVRPLIAAYMRTWYAGAVFMAIPMMGNGILISAGDSRAASGVMMLGPIVNMILNPILIFGWLGCPALGIRGSALATVIAQAVSTFRLLYLLHTRHRLLIWQAHIWHGFAASVRRMAGFAVPSILSMILMPVSATIITRILSRFGHEAVAASGAAQRIEMFAFVIPMALGMSLTPFVSQNFGAARMDRVRAGYSVATRFALGYGGLVALLFFSVAPWLASIFTDNPKVAATLVAYIRIISFGYGMMEVHRYCGFVLTGLHKPATTTVLNVIRVVGLLIPLSCLGAWHWGLKGVFAGRLATDLVSGSIGLAWVSRVLKAHNTAP